MHSATCCLQGLTAGVKTPRRGCIHITSIDLEEKPLQERHFLFLLRHPKIAAGTYQCTAPPGLDKYLVCRLHVSAGTPCVNGASMCIQHAIVWLVPRALGTPSRFICRTNLVDKVHAQLDGCKIIFSCVARMICPQISSRKNTQVLAVCAQTPTLFLPLFSTKFTTRTLPSFPLSPHHLTTANVCLCLVCVFPDFPLLGVNGFLFAVVRFGVYQELPLFAPEFLTRPSSQKSIRLISAALAPLIAVSSGLGHSWQNPQTVRLALYILAT
jgi:hypothetical protein